MIDKAHIIREIKRIANANGGKPPGVQIFERETGIKQWDWYPDTWLRWNDALEEAGYLPNKLQGRIGDEVVIEKYIAARRHLSASCLPMCAKRYEPATYRKTNWML